MNSFPEPVKVLVLNNRYPSSKKPFVASYVKSLGEVFTSLGLQVDFLVDTGNSNSKLGQIRDLARYNLKVLTSKKLTESDVLVINHFQLYWAALKKRVSPKQTLIFHWHGSEIKGSSKFQNFDEWNTDPLILDGFHVFPSEYFKNLVLEKVPGLKNWKVIPTGGVDTALFCERKKESSDTLTIGFAGHLRKEKGVDFFLRLIDQQEEIEKQTGKKLRFRAIEYGDPTGENIAKLKAKKAIELSKPMLKEEMPAYYNQLDVLVFPTRSESLGLVPIEAMACGVPVICPDDFACPEYCIPGVSGELFQPAKYDSFFKSLQNTLENLGYYTPRNVSVEKYSKHIVEEMYKLLLKELNT